jgi:hypothetical protein
MGCGVALTYIENRHQLNLESLRIKDNHSASNPNNSVNRSIINVQQNGLLKIKI